MSLRSATLAARGAKGLSVKWPQRPADIEDVVPRDVPDYPPTQPMADSEPVWPETMMPSAEDLDRLRQAPPPRPPVRAGWRFMMTHPAHLLAFGFGAGLSPRAAGTVGTLWAWVSFIVLDHWLGTLGWSLLLGAGLLVGWWAVTVTARHLGSADPGAIVWDEIIAFWFVLWIVTPAAGGDGAFSLPVLAVQLAAFALFRYFDVAKPGPVGWADRVFEARRWRPRVGTVGWPQGFGILLDDLVAACLALLVLALLAAGLALWG